jgi:hypothetical protein
MSETSIVKIVRPTTEELYDRLMVYLLDGVGDRDAVVWTLKALRPLLFPPENVTEHLRLELAHLREYSTSAPCGIPGHVSNVLHQSMPDDPTGARCCITCVMKDTLAAKNSRLAAAESIIRRSLPYTECVEGCGCDGEVLWAESKAWLGEPVELEPTGS